MSGTDTKNKELITQGPAIILVEPQLGQNIGMVARAMANFGLHELRLVNPRDGWPSEYATKAAAGALHVVENAQVFKTLDVAIKDMHFVLATTARPRDMIKPVKSADLAASDLYKRFCVDQKAGILFGRERWGLNNDEIARADEIVTFPVNPAFASLNIAQAVLLISYEWFKASISDDAFIKQGFEMEEKPGAERGEIEALYDHLEAALDKRGYFFPEARREKMTLTLRNIVTNMGLTDQEVQTLRGVVAALEGRKRKSST